MFCPLIKTEHLLLRPLEKTDAALLFRLRSDTNWAQYVGITPYRELTEAENYIRKIRRSAESGTVWFRVLALAEGADFIGTICFFNINTDVSSAEIGYDLLPEYQGKGYMYEAATAVMEYGFSHAGFDSISALPHRDNRKSVALLERLGFVCSGRVPEYEPDCREYILTVEQANNRCRLLQWR